MSGPVRPPLTVETVDGATVGRPITTLKVSNGTLTVSGSTATVATGGAGGSGTVTSVNPKADSGTGTAITTTGSFDITGGTGITTSINSSNEITITASNNGTVTSIATTAPLTGGTITGSGTIGIPEADSTTDGYLSSTDWTTFNNKGSGTVTGTGAANQVAVWSGTSAVAGSNGLLFDGTSFTVNTLGASDPVVNLSSSSKALTLQVETNQQLSIKGSSDKFIFDASSSSGGITWPDGTTQTTANNNAGTITSVSGTAPIVSSGGATPAISLANTAVTAGTYTNTDLTVDAQGRITAASSGSAGGITFPIEADSGSTGAPSYAFSADTDTGIFLSGASNMGLVAGGTSYINIGGLGIVELTRRLRNTDGTAALPAYSFSSDSDSGFWRPQADQISMSLGGTRLFDFQKSGTSGKLDFRGSSPIIECDDASADLSLRSGGGTYAEILISNENSDIEIKPAGTGKVKISDAYTLPSVVTGANDYVLTAQTDGTTAWAAAGGGGSTSPGGSDKQVQFNNSSAFGGSDRFKFDPDVGGSGNAGMGIRGNSAAFVSSGFPIYLEGNAYLSGQVFANEVLCGSTSVSDVGFGPQTDQNTGIAFTAADQVDIVTGGAFNISFGANKEILVGGTAAGTSGQVLTSGGAGAAVSWADAGGKEYPVSMATAIDLSDDTFILTSFPPYPRSVTSSSSQSIDTSVYYIPFIPPKDITLTNLQVNITSAGTGNLSLALYSSDTAGNPKTILTNSTVLVDASTTGYYTLTFSSSQSLTGLELLYIAVTMSANSCQVRAHPSTNGYTYSPISGLADFNQPLMFDSTTTTFPTTVTPSQLSTKFGICPMIGGGF